MGIQFILINPESKHRFALSVWRSRKECGISTLRWNKLKLILRKIYALLRTSSCSTTQTSTEDTLKDWSLLTYRICCSFFNEKHFCGIYFICLQFKMHLLGFEFREIHKNVSSSAVFTTKCTLRIHFIVAIGLVVPFNENSKWSLRLFDQTYLFAVSKLYTLQLLTVVFAHKYIFLFDGQPFPERVFA